MDTERQQAMDEARIEELAALSDLDYGRERKAAAGEFGITLTILDRVINAARPKKENGGAGSAVVFSEPEPWAEPVPTCELLDELVDIIKKHVSLGGHEATACALWAAMTHQADRLHIMPLLVLTSPEKRCGKSTLKRIIGRFVRRPEHTSNISAAALFRLVEEYSPTLLIDEADSFLADREDLRNVINSGHTREDAYTHRCVGDSQEIRKFSTWCPKLIAGIKGLPDTIEDRAIIIQMNRRAKGDSVARLRHVDRYETLNRKLIRWAADTYITPRDDDSLAAINDRAADNWEPLLAIARLAGEDWLRRATEAAYALSGVEDEDPSIGALLLDHIRQVFDDRHAAKLFSMQIVDALVAMEGEPWAEWKRGQPMTQTSLARMLDPYKIKARQIRIGTTTKKGYRAEWFREAFERYISSAPGGVGVLSETLKQSSTGAGFGPNKRETQKDGVSTSNPLKASNGAGCFDVSDEKGIGASGYKIPPDRDDTEKVYEEVTGGRWT